MSRSPRFPDANESDSVVVEIVEVLEENGVGRESYQLPQYVDPDALGQFVASLDGEFTVTFTVENVRVEVTQEGVTTEDSA